MSRTLILRSCPFCGLAPTARSWHGGSPEKIMICCENDECTVQPSFCDDDPSVAVREWNDRYDNLEFHHTEVEDDEVEEDEADAPRVAWRLRRFSSWHGDAALYRVDPPMLDRDGNQRSMVIISAVIPFGRDEAETCVFAAAGNEVQSWIELPASQRFVYSHETVLRDAGYVLIVDAVPALLAGTRVKELEIVYRSWRSSTGKVHKASALVNTAWTECGLRPQVDELELVTDKEIDCRVCRRRLRALGASTHLLQDHVFRPFGLVEAREIRGWDPASATGDFIAAVRIRSHDGVINIVPPEDT